MSDYATATCRECGGTITVPFDGDHASVRWPYSEHPTEAACPDCGLRQQTTARKRLT